MDYYRIREISAELSGLVAQQTAILLAGRLGSFTDMTTEQADVYTQSNDCLRELCKELDELT
jgi:hypothetical protein